MVSWSSKVSSVGPSSERNIKPCVSLTKGARNFTKPANHELRVVEHHYIYKSKHQALCLSDEGPTLEAIDFEFSDIVTATRTPNLL